MRSMADGPTGKGWEQDEQAAKATYRTGSHVVSVRAEQGEEMALVMALVNNQGTDAAVTLMYILTVLAPTLDPESRCSAWIDTAEAAKCCGLLSTETKAKKHDARMKVTRALIYGERAEVVGKRTYRGDGKKEQASSVHSVVWVISDAEYIDEGAVQGGLPSTGAKLPLNPVCPPVRAYVQLSAHWRKLLTDPEWRQYLSGFQSVASIPAGKPSGQIARAIGIGFMCECRMQIKSAAADIKGCFNGEDPKAMRARPRRWWLDEFGFDADTKTYRDHPAELVKHWAQALEILSGDVESGGAELIARKGEAANASTMLGETKERRGWNWLEEWLEEPVRFTPGPRLASQILGFERGEIVPINITRAVLNAKPGRPYKPKPKAVRLPASPLMEAPPTVLGSQN